MEIILYYDEPIWYNINDKVRIVIIEKEVRGRNSILNKALYLRQYVLKSKPDMFISFLAPFNMFSILSLINAKIPIVVAERNDPRYIPKKNYLRLVRNILYHFADKVIVQTENNKKYFSRKIQEKTEVIYNPVIINELAGKALKSSKNKKIVTVGRLVEQKNQKILIDAFKKIQKKYPDYRLIIYGEGYLRDELSNIIINYGLEEAVELAGAKKDILNHILDAQCFVLTSEFEGMPNALIEAMCLGLPSISTRVSGAVDLIEQGKNGILVDIGDVDGISNAIEMIINDRYKATALGEQAYLLNNKLNVTEITKQWLDIIDNVK